ncbi:MAG: hypothetical protein H6Q00_3326 [Holophagaceae bacterium]|nr:hypothetical protein [Holophagaceae bacterium]
MPSCCEGRQKRREIESSLREMQEKLAAVGEAASDAILMTDNHFRITYWNPMAERVFGYPATYAQGQDLFRLVLAPEARAEFEHLFQKALFLGPEHSDGRTLELMGRSRHGRETPLEISLSSVLLGGRWHAVAVLRDITQRKAREQDRIEQLHFFQTVIEAIPQPLYYKDAEGRYLGCNGAFVDYLGIPKADLIGRTLRDPVPPGLAPTHYETDMEVMSQGRCLTLETEVPCADGSPRTTIESRAPFFDIEGRVVGIVGTLLDITDRKRNEMEKANLEIQLRQAHKLEAIGQLAAGIAHEINTPTQFIGDNTIFLRDAFKDILPFLEPQGLATLPALDLRYLIEEVPKAIDQTLDGVARVTRIVRAMKEFSHPGSESKVPVDLNQCIESTLIVSHNEWKYCAELVTDYDPDLPPVPCFPNEFNQVILNLVINAAHAIQEAKNQGSPDLKGMIRVSTQRIGNDVVIKVEDNGVGIPDAIRPRIFDPFFTTKPIGQGTGQGLAIVHNVIVEKHKGGLSLESEVGKGTTFIICLSL